MLLAEPQSTPADFHFHIGQIPVRVTGWFWLVAGLLGWSSAQSLAGDDTRTLLIYLGVCMLVVFFSFLVHELGHALAYAVFGQSSRIVLYHFGGLAVLTGMPASALKSPLCQLVVSAAGPVAQLCLVIAVVAIVMMFGYQVPDPGFLKLLPIVGNSLEEISLASQPIPSMLGRLMVYYLLFVNIALVILNLLPVLPLDGGRIVLEGLKVFGVSAADQIASLFGLLIAGVVAVWAYQHQERYLMVLFGALGVGCYQRLVGSGVRG